jgi:hypothetical protein
MKRVRKFVEDNYTIADIRNIARYGCSKAAPSGLTYEEASEKFDKWGLEVDDFDEFLESCDTPAVSITALISFDATDPSCYNDHNKSLIVWTMVKAVCQDIVDKLEA